LPAQTLKPIYKPLRTIEKVVSEEKRQRFAQLLKYIRANDGVKQFAARLSIKLPTYSAWETARAFPSEPMWLKLLPQLCELSGFDAESLDRYLRGDYELNDLIEGAAQTGMQPRARPIVTLAKFRAWLQTLSWGESLQVLKDVTEWLAALNPNSSEAKRGTSAGRVKVNPALDSPPDRTEAIGAENPEAIVETVQSLLDRLSLEQMVQVDNHLRDRIFTKLQTLGLLEIRRYQNNPFYLLMENYRIREGLSYEKFEEMLLKEGREAGLDPQRTAQVIRGQLLPNNRELLWIGVFLKKSDGNLYDHEELVALRDGTRSSHAPDSSNQDSPEPHAEGETAEKDKHHYHHC
jgi:transcriptional regulator with XRE-family HTH domain